MSIRRGAWLFIATLLVALTAIGAGATWLIYTEAGLAWLSTRVAGYAGKGLTLDGVAGTLAHGASVEHIRYAGEDIELHITSAALRVSPLSLLQLKPRISGLRASEIAIVAKPGEPRGRPPDSLRLPLDFQLVDARVTRLLIDLGKGPHELTHIRLDYEGGRAYHTVRDLSLNALDHAATARLVISTLPPFALDAAVEAVTTQGKQTRGYAAIKGNLTDVAIEGSATSGSARVDVMANVRPYDEYPLTTLAARTARLDLKTLWPQLPRTALDGDLALKRSRAFYTGSLRITNAASGPYDQALLPLAALRASIRTDGTTARITDGVADLGAAGVVMVSGTLERASAKLALTTSRLDLRGLHGKLRKTSLGGQADVLIAPERQSLTAELTQSDVDLRLTANRAGDTIDVPQFRARARGGEASGEAHVELNGRQPFAVQAALTRFDPAAFGDFPAGSISATIKASGTLSGPLADLQFATRDSRWLNAPLTAHGNVKLAGERVLYADVEASLGGNQFSAQGALGGPRDTLTVRFDARRLAMLDTRLQGTARGTAQLTGSWRAPAVRFDLSGADLAHQRYGRIKTLEARGALSTHANGPFEIDAVARSLSAPQWQLRSVSLKLEGTGNAHAAVATAQGDRIEFRTRVRGSWKPGTGWAGTVQELANRGEVPVELTAPVSVSIGPQRVYAQAFELRVVGGSLGVSELDYERGRLTSSGRFNDMPVRPFVALAGGAADMAGTLRLSGQWAIRSVPHLTGSISVVREAGDVALGSDRSIHMGLQTVAVSANLAEQGATFQARIQSALVNGMTEGRVATVGGRYTTASPLTFTADVGVSHLSPFAALLDASVLLEGEARARLEARGTVADPQITGPLSADKLALALPAEGVDLKGGTLRAVLTPREVRIESFSIRGGQGELNARGTLARSGFNEASLDWRADQFTVLARPERRLVVSGNGNAALKSGKLAFTGSLKANEGLFELATTTLPTLGDDVIVVGRTVPKESAASEVHKLPRAGVDLDIDLGSNVHVLGRGLDVWLSGHMRVQTNVQGELRATGTVDARRGTFTAYGQRLEIERGRLFFNGPPSNPGLDIVAMRKRQAVEAGVAVTGTLRRPLVQVVSNPSLPEGEALSWLVLGRAPGTAGAGQLSALPLATGAIMGKAAKPLASALHLDEIGLRGSSSVSEQFLTVGKRVSDRLYVVFEQSLGGAENLLRLELSLTQRISLRAQAGQTSLLGMFYRYGWD
jgi:translocation and assembly module TamB